MGVEVTVKDSGATGLEARLAELSQSVTVGVHEDAGTYPDGTHVAVVGAAQEFGTDKIPARSWLRGWVASGGQSVIANVGQDQIGEVVDGAKPDSVSEKIGAASVKGIVSRMDRGITGAGGEEARDLQDTGRLVESITFEVES